MNRAELVEHMLTDSYHSVNRKRYIRELAVKGEWVGTGPGPWKRTLRQGTVMLKSMHANDHNHPAHEHGD